MRVAIDLNGKAAHSMGDTATQAATRKPRLCGIDSDCPIANSALSRPKNIGGRPAGPPPRFRSWPQLDAGKALHLL